MTAPTAAMIKAGADWFRQHDADSAVDYSYEQLVTLIWTEMETARVSSSGTIQGREGWSAIGEKQVRWDDAVGRELVHKGRLRGTR